MSIYIIKKLQQLFMNVKNARGSLFVLLAALGVATNVSAQILPSNPNGVASCSSGTAVVLRTLGVGQTVSIVTGATFLNRTTPINLVANGSLEAPVFANIALGGAGGISSNLTSWLVNGGGPSTYANIIDETDPTITINMNGVQGMYFGNDVIASAVPPLPASPSGGYWNLPANQVLNPTVGYGTATTPVSLSQTITTVIGNTYRLSFANGWELGFTTAGIVGVKIGAYPYAYLSNGPGQPPTQTIEFVATSTSTAIIFSNWGHSNDTTGTEFAIDDIIVNACPLAAASIIITKTDGKSSTISGTTNSYVVGITNQGPASANGIVFTDVAVLPGLTCPAGAIVTCSVTAGLAACPAGPLTFANITTGLTISTLPANSALQFAYTCNVN